MEKPKEQEALSVLSIQNIWIPLLIGVAMPLYLFASDKSFTWDSLQLIAQADKRYLFLVFVTILVRDFSYVLRIKLITNNQLGWLGSFYIAILWEFSSAATPSAVGGGFIVIFLLLREGINFAQALSYVILSIIFDNIFFLAAAFLGVQGFYGPIFESVPLESSFGASLLVAFWSTCTFMLCYTAVVLISFVIWPGFFKWILVQVTRLPLLRRWQAQAHQQGEEIIVASEILRKKKATYWLQVSLATLLLLAGKYLLVNFIMAAYVPLSLSEHWLVFGRQLIMWIVMLVSPTPGSSGTAEFFYQQLHGAMLGDYTLITVVIWRFLTSYYYLIFGAIILPYWLRRVLKSSKNTSDTNNAASDR